MKWNLEIITFPLLQALLFNIGGRSKSSPLCSPVSKVSQFTGSIYTQVLLTGTPDALENIALLPVDAELRLVSVVQVKFSLTFINASLAKLH